MPTIIANDFRPGVTVIVDGRVMQVVDYQRVKPGKGHSFLRTRLRDLERGGMISKTFPSEEKIEQAFLETRKAQFTYREGDTCYFMDTESFEQEAVSAAELDRLARYLQEGMEVSIRTYGGRRVSVELPDFVEARVVETDPGLKGDTAAGGSKPAKIETGATVTVPLFVNIGDRIRVDTRTGQYVQRVSGD
jgi:elongation factor P